MTDDLNGRLEGLAARRGEHGRDLLLGPLAVRLRGLDARLAGIADERWGPFLESIDERRRPTATVELFDAGDSGWLPAWEPGEGYRLEARRAATGASLLCSYHFGLAEATAGRWRLGLTRTDREPYGRVLDNALRALTARLVAAHGGFAMHGAAVLREGRAWVVAGPSGAGKSTAVRLLRPAPSLGDDFAVVLPDPVAGWTVPALPFDNAERIAPGAERGAWPLAGIWRLEQAGETSVAPAHGPLGRASLMGVLAFPWALPEHAGALLDAVGSVVDAGRYARLRFTIDATLWTVLVDRPSEGR